MFTAIHRIETNCYDRPKDNSQWHIRVLGLPHTGAKSRVETQIKICLQLVDTSGELVTHWSHLKLPEHLVAKDKLKRKNQKYGTDEKTAMIDSQVLTIEAVVICESHPDSGIIMCPSCVHRERKRLKRKRDNKVSRAANKEGGAAKVAALFANDLPDLNDEKIMAEERKRILLFNCNEYIEFNNGEATLPTRVTCYCRHHSEKIGFRIVFTVRDNQNHVIATGRSPPIMITDDHKSSKMQQAAAKKRARADVDVSASENDVPSVIKRKIGIDLETDSGISSPVASTPATPSSQLEDIPESPVRTSEPASSSLSFNIPSSTEYMAPQGMMPLSIQKHPLSVDSTDDHYLLQSTSTYNQSSVTQNDIYDFLNSDDMNILSHSSTSQSNNIHASVQPPQDHHLQVDNHHLQVDNHPLQHQQHHHQHHHQPTQPNPQEREQEQSQLPLSLVHPDHQQQQILSLFAQNPLNVAFNNQRRLNTHGINTNLQPYSPLQWQAQNNVYTKLQERNAIEGNKSPNLPRLHRLIPSEGPIYGGAEVTVLGSNFYEGLTCLFGDNPAIPTHCWSPNTLLCILPPAPTAGPVVVSFKEHPLVLEGQDVVLFTYFDESDRALMELALQVVGLKTMGKVEDARQIAMRIVQGDNSDRHDANGYQNGALKNNKIQSHYTMTTLAATAVYDNARQLFLSRLEEHVMSSILSLHQMGTTCHDYLSLTNQNQHSLLHLATICGYIHLVRILVQLHCDVNQVDKNGFTALHFASWSGKVEIVKILIQKTDLKIVNNVGKTAERLAIEAGHKSVVDLFRQMHQIEKKKVARIHPPTMSVYLPSTLTYLLSSNLLSSLYTFPTNARCIQRVVHSAAQVYNFMFDPF
ncbi:hypothetical protein BDB01DRAFT_785140 [Pilobolus umbonatus]|nr:hypothetical protein BDB01DRAFT_785140 [Pilobolus umbonatus]